MYFAFLLKIKTFVVYLNFLFYIQFSVWSHFIEHEELKVVP